MVVVKILVVAHFMHISTNMTNNLSSFILEKMGKTNGNLKGEWRRSTLVNNGNGDQEKKWTRRERRRERKGQCPG